MSLFDCFMMEDDPNLGLGGCSMSLLEETVGGSASSSESHDILGSSMAMSGLLHFVGGDSLEDDEDEEDLKAVAPGGDVERGWDSDADALLDSLLQGPSGTLEGPFSDTSSDSGCNLEQQLLSPLGQDETIIVPHSPEEQGDDNNIRFIDFATDSPPDVRIVNRITSTSSSNGIRIATANDQQFHTGTTTIVLPVMNIRHAKQLLPPQSPQAKRRRVSASSSDSGLDDPATTTTFVTTNGITKYPPLVLNEEERRLCERESIRLPSHYPLSREEEKNLKRIRRKIRNKVSAQDSRKRKKEYVDAMEDRVKACADQNDELTKKIQLLETQNKTLAGQLRRLHQIIVNGGGGIKGSQTSTAMMVLLLSTALFLIPGLKEQQQSESKMELDITQAIKMPPMPGQSRSLLQFTQAIKQEYGTPMNNAAHNKKNFAAAVANLPNEEDMSLTEDVKPPKFGASISSDHDYYVNLESASGAAAAAAAGVLSAGGGGGRKSILDTSRKIVSYIEEDAPPQGYGPGKASAFGNNNNNVEVVERRINVTRGPGNQAMRTVVVQFPKDMK